MSQDKKKYYNLQKIFVATLAVNAPTHVTQDGSTTTLTLSKTLLYTLITVCSDLTLPLNPVVPSKGGPGRPGDGVGTSDTCYK